MALILTSGVNTGRRWIKETFEKDEKQWNILKAGGIWAGVHGAGGIKAGKVLFFVCVFFHRFSPFFHLLKESVEGSQV